MHMGQSKVERTRASRPNIVLAMLLLAYTIYSLSHSPVLPGIIAGISITWFLIHLYLTRNDSGYAPLENKLEC